MSHTVLQFDYAEVDGLTIVEVSGLGALRCDDGAWAYDQVMLGLTDGSTLVIRVTDDSDELMVERLLSIVQSGSIGSEYGVIAELGYLCGLELGWCWVGTNWRGYKDMFTLSFSNLKPQLVFLAESSKVFLYKLEAHILNA